MDTAGEEWQKEHEAVDHTVFSINIQRGTSASISMISALYSVWNSSL